MNTQISPRPTGSLLTAFSAVALSGFLLASCTTDDEYARQLCLDKGIAASASAYSDCVGEQKDWIEYNRRRFSTSRPNG